MDRRDRLRLVGGIVVFTQLVQNDTRAVVQLHLVIRSFIVVRFDIFVGRNKINVMDGIEMGFSVL